MKKTWLGSLFILALIYSGYYYIYESGSYAKKHLTKVNYPYTDCSSDFICDDGYYIINYPTHKKIVHKHYVECQVFCGSFTRQLTFLENVDTDSFKALGREYGIDKSNLYLRGKIIEKHGSNVDKFNSIAGDGFDFYLKGPNEIYFNGFKLHGSDQNDFRFISKQDNNTIASALFLITNDKVFFGSTEVQAIRNGKIYTKSFETVKKLNTSFCDNYQKIREQGMDFYSCNITSSGEDSYVNIDTSTLEIIPSESYPINYLKDKNYIYYCNITETGCKTLYVVENANPKTFNESNYSYGCYIRNITGYKPARRDLYSLSPDGHPSCLYD